MPGKQLILLQPPWQRGRKTSWSKNDTFLKIFKNLYVFNQVEKDCFATTQNSENTVFHNLYLFYLSVDIENQNVEDIDLTAHTGVSDDDEEGDDDDDDNEGGEMEEEEMIEELPESKSDS